MSRPWLRIKYSIFRATATVLVEHPVVSRGLDDSAPRLKVLKTVEPPGRKAGVKVANAAELLAKLKEAGALS